MPSSVRQQREAARAKLEARMAEKAAAARRTRRIQVTLASVLALVLVGGIGFLLYKVISTANTTDTTATGDDGPTEEEMVPAGDGQPVEQVDITALTMSDPASADDGTAECAYVPASDEERAANPNLQDAEAPADGAQPASGTQTMTIQTNHGDLTVEIDTENAPCTAASFTALAGQGYFDGSECHRLTTEGIFVLQCGDPTATGSGGPGYSFANENLPHDTAEDLTEEEIAEGKKPEPNYMAGTIAMANSGPDTNGSQFFIVYEDTYLPADYTVFGELTEGLDIVREIAQAGAEVPASQQQMPMG
ncbi:peptidyl-prolyl cis-trans isomerase B (cyclophilin B) [Stackebrandtia albiflava]|uniref:Peptidyl-prolyl cis-trans isomerase B (Cyclophilin B) n=1 Tax=Stackebrandtia albiflava TaxID=406432 RepID=A0A562VCY0_9ACTN|nr:peptidylprolyl isomerase [Stackebrandtia albiflava]TWJ15671.1 peptidyl-prolyl cis-trans isomerase B (cyclophilin B) [Stackebrandtia albiflava]